MDKKNNNHKMCCVMENKFNNKKYNMLVIGVLYLLVLFVFHAEHTNAVDVDFFDNWGFGGGVPLSIGNQFDKISWIESDCPLGVPDDQWMTLGVLNSVQNVTAYCVNTDREADVDFDLCIIKNTDEAVECQLTSTSFPTVTFNASENTTDWAEAFNVLQLFSTPVCNNEIGNTYTKSTQGIKRGQIEYYGITNKDKLIFDTDGEFAFAGDVNTPTEYVKKIIVSEDILRRIAVYLSLSSPTGNLEVSLKDGVNGSVIQMISRASGSILDTQWNIFDFNDIFLNSSIDYYIELACPNCVTGRYWWLSCPIADGSCDFDNQNISTDDGNTWSPYTGANTELSLRVYADDGCGNKGTSSNSANFDYYFVDNMISKCLIDGASAYNVQGNYSGTTTISIGNVSCGVSKQCDSDHDDTNSSVPTILPFTPCKTRTGFACNVSNDCWNNAVCNGSKILYDSTCDGEFTDIDKNTYSNGCGNISVLDSVTVEQADGNCTSDGGFPPNYRCDSIFDGIEYTSVGNVYNNVCKGWIGVSCTVDNDCHSSLECESGFCGFDATAVYTHIPDKNSINKTNVVTFDNSLSVSTDNDIQFACWIIDGSNIECDGNSTQCATSCSGGAFDNPNWDEGFIRTFNSGGNFIVKLSIGSEGLYNSNYQESFCVSGDGTTCFSCFDNLLNDDETSIDWGGNCGFPYFIRCNNNILDNVTNETSIDYGGACGNCENSSIDEDVNLNLLIQTQLIVYPFNITQCDESEAVQGGVVLFVIIISSILIVPLILFIIVLLVILIFFGTGTIGLLIGIAGRNNRMNNLKKLINNMRNNKK